MEYNNDKMKKFAKKSEFETELDEKKIGFERLTNIEAFQQEKFPEKLIEEFKTPENLPDKPLLLEIESKHREILEGRPLPELLENSEMIGYLEEINPPTMGKLYVDKKNKEYASKDKSLTEE